MKPTAIIFGANGFLGRYLTRDLTRHGYEVVAVARNRNGWSGDGMFLEWDGRTLGPWALALEGASVVINLAGRSVNCRYNETNRREILDSRVESTRIIGTAIAQCEVPPKVWFNSSTATLYRHAEDHGQDEWTGEQGTGFSCDVARAWEDAFFGCKTPPETRKLALRTGMVLGNQPGTVFNVLKSLTQWGLGGTMGKGNQHVSWIHVEDFLRVIRHLIDQPLIDGPVNVTAPSFPTNRELMRSFREVIGMPIGLPATRWMLKIGARVMRTETELILKSRWGVPTRLTNEGFRWRWPHISDALHDLQSRPGLDTFFRAAKTRSVGARAWLPATTR